jgi:8-oxo-dGTP pyrophosphatase MutT (NUDIX family)
MMKLNNKKMQWEGWITPGGGMEPDEDSASTLKRELYEELGLGDFEIGPQVWYRTHQLHWAGQDIEQSEKFYLIKTSKFEPKPMLELNEHEKAAFEGFKWWSVDELLTSREVFAPKMLPTLLKELVTAGAPVFALSVE